jgi:hypothetical protein
MNTLRRGTSSVTLEVGGFVPELDASEAHVTQCATGALEKAAMEAAEKAPSVREWNNLPSTRRNKSQPSYAGSLRSCEPRCFTGL